MHTYPAGAPSVIYNSSLHPGVGAKWTQEGNYIYRMKEY